MVYENCFLVIIYNKQFHESLTLQSFYKAGRNILNKNTKLIIWNNGPSLINEDVLIKKLNGIYDLDIIQKPINDALSSIYNTFINLYISNKYIFIDDDTILNKEYLSDVNMVKPNQFCVPLIINKNKIEGPFLDNIKVNGKGDVTNKGQITAIGSGMVVGQVVITNVIKKYDSVFDERFWLYGVDVSFCYRVSNVIPSVNTVVISAIHHSLSRLEVESEVVSIFRMKERSYDLGLRLRHYNPNISSFLILIRVVANIFIKKVFNKKNRMNASHVIKAYFSGVHHKR